MLTMSNSCGARRIGFKECLSLPLYCSTPSKMKPIRLKGSRRKKGVKSVFRAFPFEIHSWFQLAESRNQFRGRQQANWLGALWFPWTRYCFDPNNELISQIGCSAFEEAVRVGHPCPEFAEVMPSLGRLGQSIEGGGSVGYLP